MRVPLRRTPTPSGQTDPPGPQPRRRSRLLAWASAGTVGLLAVGCLVWFVQHDPDDGPTAASRTPTSPIPRTGPDPEFRIEIPPLRPTPTPQPKPRIRAGSPERLLIPRLGVDSAIVPITAPGGTLTPPADAQQVGWWSPGAEPGARTGSALVTGHTLSRGGAALQDLETLEVGDRIAVRTVNGRIGYRVRDVQVFDKGSVAEQAGELFSQTSPGRLVVITCEDYNGSVYLSNVVVTARPIGRAVG
ncbi:MAG: class F sortase [Nocardioides sp.]|uniref:class F sortase n=1 Tax=Nocardioides sp. TaxID=35761 RepID=UPI0023860BE8|nr:class F sortase [Nocardioides sp.]MDE0778653.1 class F sortase [Nocardioides sp.]